jgi:hypothetical protein
MVPRNNQVLYLPDGTEYSGKVGPMVRVRYIRTLPGGFQQQRLPTPSLTYPPTDKPSYTTMQPQDFPQKKPFSIQSAQETIPRNQDSQQPLSTSTFPILMMLKRGT